jgi:phosphatidylinositol glycan class A protein
MTNGLKVYYLPLSVCFDQVIYPTLYAFFPLFRNILIRYNTRSVRIKPIHSDRCAIRRERVSIVHGHQGTSSLANECMLYARCMGFHVCYTDHSLFGFADMASIHMNKVCSSCESPLSYFSSTPLPFPLLYSSPVSPIHLPLPIP